MKLPVWLNWLQQPYPHDTDIRRGISNSIAPGIIVALFLIIFQPFGLGWDRDSMWAYFRICLLFGAITSVISALWWGADYWIYHKRDERRWTVGQSLLSVLGLVFFIGLGNYAVGVILWRQPFTLSGAIGWQWRTMAVAIVPTLIIYLVSYIRLSQKYLSGAVRLSEQLPVAHTYATVAPPEQVVIALSGDNLNERLTLPPQALLYMEAADNYVQVFYENEQGEIKRHLMRGALRRLADQLPDSGEFWRCHRTYLVNLNRVTSVSGNAQGYRLLLDRDEVEVPVSRSLNAEIEARLQRNAV